MKAAKVTMWIFCVLAVLLLAAGLLGPTLGVRATMAMKPATERTEELQDFTRIQWKERRQGLYTGAFVAFLIGSVAAFVGLNRPPD